MKKSLESTDIHSCWNRARDDETVFVLLGRDAAACAAIHAWVGARLALGKNQGGDQQIQEALRCAYQMQQEASKRR